MNYFESITDCCHYLLNNFPAAKQCKDYIDIRLNSGSQTSFKLGYFPPANYIDALIMEIGEEPLYKAELILKFEVSDSLCPRTVNRLFFEHHPLIMPYRDVYGKIIGLMGRTLLSEDERKKSDIAKYKNTTFKKGNNLFGLFESKKNIIENDSVFIVEGQFDVIKAHEIGLKNVVALGSANMTMQQFTLISRYTRNIKLLLDNDDAGEKGRSLIMQKFGQHANIKNFYLQQTVKDLDECLSLTPEMPYFIVKN